MKKTISPYEYEVSKMLSQIIDTLGSKSHKMIVLAREIVTLRPVKT